METDPLSLDAMDSEPDLTVPAEEVVYRVSEAFHGMRLDQFLRRKLVWRSRNSIQSVIREKRIRVNGCWLKPGRRVYDGDRVVIHLPPVDPADVKHDEIPLRFLYEDEHIAVLDKQPGIIVHPVSNQLYNTLINAIHYHYQIRLGLKHVRPRLAHRLDRDTSGVLLVSKDKSNRRTLQDTFESHRVRKHYFAFVRGRVEADAGEIDAPLAQTRRPLGGVRMVVRDDGLPSLTRFEVLERFEEATYIKLEPHTGRTHQLRAHMAHLGHPMFCDAVYGRETGVRLPGDREPMLKRQALHSCSLRFPHPVTDEPMHIESPLPDDIARAVDAARAGQDFVSLHEEDDPVDPETPERRIHRCAT